MLKYMIESPDTDHEAAQRLLLRRNRGLATGLLLIVLVLMGLNVMLQRRLARRDAARQAVGA